MSAEERREVVREAIHRTICDPRSSHDASLGRCSVAADAVAMDLAAGVSVPTEPGAPDLPALIKEWADSEDVVRDGSPTGEDWQRVFAARAALRLAVSR